MMKIPVLFEVSARERKTTGMFVLLVIFVVLIYIIFPDRLQNLDLLRTQLKHQNDLIKSREIKKARLLEFQKELIMLKDEGENVYGMFFNREDIVNFLKSINDLAEIKTGNDLLIVHTLPEVEIKTQQQGKNESSAIFKRKTIKLAVEGSYKSLEELIALFDNYGKNLQIERISLENDPRASIIRASLELVIYVIAEVDNGFNKSDNLKIESVRERAEKRSISEGDYGLEEPFIPMSVTTVK